MGRSSSLRRDSERFKSVEQTELLTVVCTLVWSVLSTSDLVENKTLVLL